MITRSNNKDSCRGDRVGYARMGPLWGPSSASNLEHVLTPTQFHLVPPALLFVLDPDSEVFSTSSPLTVNLVVISLHVNIVRQINHARKFQFQGISLESVAFKFSGTSPLETEIVLVMAPLELRLF